MGLLDEMEEMREEARAESRKLHDAMNRLIPKFEELNRNMVDLNRNVVALTKAIQKMK